MTARSDLLLLLKKKDKIAGNGKTLKPRRTSYIAPKTMIVQGPVELTSRHMQPPI